MGAWLYYCDVDGTTIRVDTREFNGGAIGKYMFGVPETEEASMSVTYNIRELCTKCGLVPWDICIKKMSGAEALPLLKSALKNLESMSETELWLDNIRAKLIYAQGTVDYLRKYMYKEDDETTRSSYEKSKLDFIRQLSEIMEPVWGVTRQNVTRIYEMMIFWIQNDPKGHFEIGSH